MSEHPLTPGYLLGGRFHLVRKLGEGAVGDVWLAADVHLHDEPVACKILSKSFADDRRAIADLKREVLLTRKLRHPNIVAVHSFWDSDGERFITMEYIGGKSLAQLLTEREQPFPLVEILPWVRQLCEALDHAHRQSILHRDVKPANILLGADGEVRLTDFGIARTAREASARMLGHVTSGTLLYMSPEQLMGDPLDPRTDLYSLAATIYECLSGAPPFYKGSIAAQIQSKPPMPIPHQHEAINRVLLRALSKSPAERHQTCREFHEDLAGVAELLKQSGSPPDLSPPVERVRPEEQITQQIETVRPPTRANAPKPLGTLLVDAGLITRNQLVDALRKHAETGLPVGAVLVQAGYVREDRLVDVLQRQLGLPRVDWQRETVDPELTRRFSRKLAEEHECLPIRIVDGVILLAMVDPLDFTALNLAEAVFGLPVDPRVTTESALRSAIERAYG